MTNRLNAASEAPPQPDSPMVLPPAQGTLQDVAGLGLPLMRYWMACTYEGPPLHSVPPVMPKKSSSKVAARAAHRRTVIFEEVSSRTGSARAPDTSGQHLMSWMPEPAGSVGAAQAHAGWSQDGSRDKHGGQKLGCILEWGAACMFGKQSCKLSLPRSAHGHWVWHLAATPPCHAPPCLRHSACRAHRELPRRPPPGQRWSGWRGCRQS